MDGLGLSNGSVDILVRKRSKERDSSDYIKSWENATRGDATIIHESIDGFKTNCVKFEVVSARTVESSSKKYVAYTIMVRSLGELADPHPAVFERRYTDFLFLYNTLKRDFPQLIHSISFPKKAFIGNFTPETISTRSAGFEEFLTLISMKKQLKESKAVTKFLQHREIIEALKLIEENQFDKAKPLLENSFWLVNKMLTDRTPVVLRCLCLLVAVCAECFDQPHALALASLAVHRYQAVSDTDLLRYYIPLLETSKQLYERAGKDFEIIDEHILDLRRKGINVDSSMTLMSTVLKDLKSLLDVK